VCQGLTKAHSGSVQSRNLKFEIRNFISMLPLSDFKIQKKNNFNLIGKIKVRVIVIIGSLVAFSFFAQLVFANNIATDGQKLAQIQNETKKLESENTTLKVRIAQESSLATLTQKAQELNFRRPSKIITP